MELEIWKDIKGYEGLYQISNLGNVKSLGNKSNHKEEILMKQNLNFNGYLYIGLRSNSKRKIFRVHRLVAEAFIPNPLGKEEVNHINCNKTDNRACNLEWNTRQENQSHAEKNLSKYISAGRKHAIEKNSKKVKISKFPNEDSSYMIFDSLSEGARFANVNVSNAWKCVKGKIRSIGGYRFEYI
ncbi:MAG TPA: NUMOD4 motif-containing HNH endonuclease [Candidatus Pelethenecus sp.]|nr:NUMOD4 motif-containing HNH endonuclease [Candidatus Pelethenecus sp.]